MTLLQENTIMLSKEICDTLHLRSLTRKIPHGLKRFHMKSIKNVKYIFKNGLGLSTSTSKGCVSHIG